MDIQLREWRSVGVRSAEEMKKWKEILEELFEHEGVFSWFQSSDAVFVKRSVFMRVWILFYMLSGYGAIIEGWITRF